MEQLNFAFHRTIYRMARAPKISWLLGATPRDAPREFLAAVPVWLEASAHDHHAVLRARPRRQGGTGGDQQARHRSGGAARRASRPAEPPAEQTMTWRIGTAVSSMIELLPANIVQPA